MIALWNRDTAYDPAEQQPVEEGKRGLANDLTCRAVLGKVVTKTPDKVLDLSAQVTCDRWLKGKKENLTLNAKKTSFVLDGKLAPPKIAAVAGREAVLCHYRRDKVPHKILVRSHDDSIRGTIVATEFGNAPVGQAPPAATKSRSRRMLSSKSTACLRTFRQSSKRAAISWSTPNGDGPSLPSLRSI